MTTRRAQRVSPFGAFLSVVMLLLLIVMLIAIVANVLYGAMPALKKTGYFTPQIERVQIEGNEVIRLFHKGGDSFVLNTTPDSPQHFWLGIYIESDGVLRRVNPAPTLSKYLFEQGDIVYIFRSGNVYLFTNSLADARSTAIFSPDSYYLILRDEDQQITTVRAGPFGPENLRKPTIDSAGDGKTA